MRIKTNYNYYSGGKEYPIFLVKREDDNFYLDCEREIPSMAWWDLFVKINKEFNEGVYDDQRTETTK